MFNKSKLLLGAAALSCAISASADVANTRVNGYCMVKLNSDDKEHATLQRFSFLAEDNIPIEEDWANISLVNNVQIPAYMTVDSPASFVGSYTVTNIAGRAFQCEMDPGNVHEYQVRKVFINCVKTVSVPGTITTIGDEVFQNCASLTTVNIPSSVTTLGHSTFENCTSLVTVDFQPNLSTGILPNNTFKGCTSLTEVTLPESITFLGFESFSGCSSLEKINIKSTHLGMAGDAFDGVDLHGVTITVPAGVNINEFSALANLGATVENEKVDPVLRQTFDIDGIKYMTTSVDPMEVTVQRCPDSYVGTTVNIPQTVNYLGNEYQVVAVSGSAFALCGNITSVTLPEGLREIGESAFDRCYALESINLPSTLTSIGLAAFDNTNISSLVVPESVTTLATGTFSGMHALTEIVFNGPELSLSANALANATFNGVSWDYSPIDLSEVVVVIPNATDLDGFDAIKDLVACVKTPDGTVIYGTEPVKPEFDRVGLGPVASLTDGHFYYIYDAHGDDGTDTEIGANADHRYAFRKAIADGVGTSVKGTHIKPVNANAQGSLNKYSVWKAVATESGAWKFQNMGNGYYISGTSGDVSVSEIGNATAHVLEPVSDTPGTFKVKAEGTNNARWDGNANTNMVYWNGDGHPICFYEALVDGDDYKFKIDGYWNVTFNYPAFNGKVITRVVEVADGIDATPSIPAFDYLNITGVTNSDPIVSYKNKEFNVAGNWAFPMVPNRVYRMKNKPSENGNKYIWFDGTHAFNTYTDVDQNEVDPNLFWYFKVSEFTDEAHLSVTIHSLGMNESKGLFFGTDNNAQGIVSDTATPWWVERTTAANSEPNDFTLRHTAPDVVSYINDRGGYLSTWTNSQGKGDAGSVMRLFELLDEDWTKLAEGSATQEEIKAAKANPTPAAILGLISKMTIAEAEVNAVVAAGDYIVNTLDFGNADDRAAWQTAKGTVVSGMKPAAFNALKDAYHVLLTNVSLHMPESGKHVKFRHPQNPVLMGMVNGNIQRNGAEGTTTFTLKPAEGGFTIFNEYANAYLQHPAQTNHNVTLVENVGDATVYTLDRETIAMAEDCTNYNFGIKTAANESHPYLHCNSGYAQTNVVKWTMGRQSSWYIEPSNAETAANEYLAGAKAHYAAQEFGTGMGEYGLTADSKAAADAANAVGDDASTDDKRAAGLTLRSLEASLNMPQPGHIYMFSKIDGSKYMSCDTVSDTFATMVEPTEANLLSRLFYLDDEHHLVAVADGLVMGAFLSTDKGSAGHSWRTVMVTNTDKVGVFSFSESATTGKYVVAAQGNNRNMYNDHADVDCGGTPEATGYHWTIEEVTEIPVPGTSVDKTTLCLPFAVEICNGMSVYTAKVANGKIMNVPFEGNVIPANTPVIVDFNGVQRNEANNLVYLTKAAESPAAVEGNELLGSVYAFEPTAPVALRSGDTFVQTNASVIKGGKAYVSGAALYTFSTGNIEAEIEALVGKVFAIENTNGRGYLCYNEGHDGVWTTARGVDYDATSPNFHWTLVQDNAGKRYLYNVGARKFAGLYTVKANVTAGGQAEFVWSFSDYPTAIDFHFYDNAITENLADAVFNIIGGERGTAPEGTSWSDASRPAGMQVMTNSTFTHPIAGVSGNTKNDGCGFRIVVIENVTPGEVASVDEALAEMEAQHTAAVDYIAFYDEASSEIPGHFNAEGYAAFSAAMNAEATDAESKYYVLTRARSAAGNNINTFVDGDAYRLFDGDGNTLVAKIDWDDSRSFYSFSTGIADGTEADFDLNWLCTIDEDGNVEFTHGFVVPKTASERNASSVRARISPSNKVVTASLAEPAPANYDGLGNISLGNFAVKSSSSLGADAETTGISEINASDDADGAYYDLQGRKTVKPAKGFYIHNGSKVFVR